jgi:YD repeat-containing protein
MVEDGPATGNGDAVTFTYSNMGDLIRIENSMGHAIVMGDYTNYGYPGYSIDVNGVRTDFVYDSRGRPSEVRLALPSGVRTTRYEYDAFGKLASVIGPDGVRVSNLYDVAGRLISTSIPEPGGSFAESRYTYNALSLPTSETIQRVFADPGRGTQP